MVERDYNLIFLCLLKWSLALQVMGQRYLHGTQACHGKGTEGTVPCSRKGKSIDGGGNIFHLSELVRV